MPDADTVDRFTWKPGDVDLIDSGVQEPLLDRIERASTAEEARALLAEIDDYLDETVDAQEIAKIQRAAARLYLLAAD